MRFVTPFKQYLGKWIETKAPDERGNKMFLYKLKGAYTTTGRAIAEAPEDYFITIDLYATGRIEWGKFWPKRESDIREEAYYIVESTRKDLRRLLNWIFK